MNYHPLLAGSALCEESAASVTKYGAQYVKLTKSFPGTAANQKGQSRSRKRSDCIYTKVDSIKVGDTQIKRTRILPSEMFGEFNPLPADLEQDLLTKLLALEKSGNYVGAAPDSEFEAFEYKFHDARETYRIDQRKSRDEERGKGTEEGERRRLEELFSEAIPQSLVTGRDLILQAILRDREAQGEIKLWPIDRRDYSGVPMGDSRGKPDGVYVYSGKDRCSQERGVAGEWGDVCCIVEIKAKHLRSNRTEAMRQFCKRARMVFDKQPARTFAFGRIEGRYGVEWLKLVKTGEKKF